MVKIQGHFVSNVGNILPFTDSFSSVSNSGEASTDRNKTGNIIKIGLSRLV